MNCKQEGCAREAHAKGWCMAHYIRNRKGIAMEAPIRAHRPRIARNGLCRGPACDRKIKRQGYCQTHYLRSIFEPERMSQPVPLRNAVVYQIGISADMLEAAQQEKERRGIELLVPILREWMQLGHEAWLEARRLEAKEKWEKGKWRRGA